MKFRYQKLPVLVPLPMPTMSLSLLGRYKQLVFGVRRWKLAEPFRFWLDLDDGQGEQKFVIPKDFEFDGASIPKAAFSVLLGCLLWPLLSAILGGLVASIAVAFVVGVLLLLSPVGLMLVQGLVHDWIYKERKLLLSKRGNPVYIEDIPQIQADKVFLVAGLAVNGFPIVNHGAYLVLRLVGRFAWNGHRRREKALSA